MSKPAKAKKQKETTQSLTELRSKLSDLKLKLARKELKNTSEIRVVKRSIARTLTLTQEGKA